MYIYFDRESTRAPIPEYIGQEYGPNIWFHFGCPAMLGSDVGIGLNGASTSRRTRRASSAFSISSNWRTSSSNAVIFAIIDGFFATNSSVANDLVISTTAFYNECGRILTMKSLFANCANSTFVKVELFT